MERPGRRSTRSRARTRSRRSTIHHRPSCLAGSPRRAPRFIRVPQRTPRRGPARRDSGTLLTFEPPAPQLRAALRERCGLATSARRPRRRRSGPRSRYYRAHLHEGGDAAGAGGAAPPLRRGDAARAARASPVAPDALTDGAAGRAALPRLSRTPRRRCVGCASAGCRLVVVSNWDDSLHERLAETGLAPLVDGAVASAEVGCGQAGRRRSSPTALRARAGARRGRAARRRLARRGRRRRARGRPARGAGRARAALPPPCPPACR